ncbi:hypothetical protein [Ancylobacter lacus]|uniref:hypothetical protein n=1 Tax=Ancylobacter lacus TaxID=2579970 RepID=UPI001BCE6248|nr:hypothetical protein [Ancylobacter lacus]MBS7539660.1 hypothetical protein [Ancylobacter lacus]
MKPLRGRAAAGVLAFCAGLCAQAACADPIPAPHGDYAVSGRVAADNVLLDIAASGRRLRIDVGLAGKGAVTGFLDRGKEKLVVLADIQGLRGNAVELDLPRDYLFLNLPDEGEWLHRDRVANEICDVWRTTTSSGTVDACVTPDGIVVRAQTFLRDQPQTLFEATRVTRGPQDPARMDLPPGVKVRHIPKSMESLLGLENMLPGLGR